MNGGFAEYLLADPNYVDHIPSGLTATEAASAKPECMKPNGAFFSGVRGPVVGTISRTSQPA